jgi:hypothetical protein
MTEISKDQAVTALILWDRFRNQDHPPKQAYFDTFIEVHTVSGARYAMVDMAAQVDAIFDLLPPEEQERATQDDTFYDEMLGAFDYLNADGPVLKHSPQVMADWFEANFGLSALASIQH